MKHTFKVALSEGSTQHEVSIITPAYATASDAQRQVMWAEGMNSVTIKVQGTLRRRLNKGIKGEALQKEAQAAWDAILNNRPRTAIVKPVIDAEALGLSLEQCEALEAQGCEVINKPEDEDLEDEEQDEDEEQ